MLVEFPLPSGQQPTGVALHPTEPLLCVTDNHNSITIWNLGATIGSSAPVLLHTLPHAPRCEDAIVRATAFSSDGKRLHIVQDNDILIWALEATTPPRLLHTVPLGPTDIAFPPNSHGDRLYSEKGNRVSVWNLTLNPPERMYTLHRQATRHHLPIVELGGGNVCVADKNLVVIYKQQAEQIMNVLSLQLYITGKASFPKHIGLHIQAFIERMGQECPFGPKVQLPVAACALYSAWLFFPDLILACKAANAQDAQEHLIHRVDDFIPPLKQFIFAHMEGGEEAFKVASPEARSEAVAAAYEELGRFFPLAKPQ
jgi:hypothetical protein